MLTYDEPVFRPPGESNSLLLQVTLGCSHNRCTFCAMYRGKTFRVRTREEIEHDLNIAAGFLGADRQLVHKLFLCDGDALAAPAGLLSNVLKCAAKSFPRLRRASLYASASNVLQKTPDELAALRRCGLSLAYVGLESGAEAVLRLTAKGNSAEEAEAALNRLAEAGWQTSVIVMLGLGGKAFAEEHRRATAELLSRSRARFLSFLTTTAVPGTPYHLQVKKGAVEELSSRELLEEMRFLVASIEARERIIVRANHVSNQFPLEGVLPKDRRRMLRQLEEWIERCPPGLYPRTNPFAL